jgi:5-oxoprolinase (ATP-hydrolysing) subunit A
MGEGMPNDILLMPFISSVNIACGYHAGDEKTMNQTVERALQHAVHIGAHPSYPDRTNFGRTNMHFSAEAVYDMVKKQVETLMHIAQKHHTYLHHVKAHGALYNMAAQDDRLAKAICEAVKSLDKELIIYGLSGSAMIHNGLNIGLKCYNEVFADRTYQQNGTLTPRSCAGALHVDTLKVKQQVLDMVFQKRVLTMDGVYIPIQADTICLHGDGEHAVSFAKMIYDIFYTNTSFIYE